MQETAALPLRPSCNDTVQCAYIIFQFGSKSPSAVRTATTGESTTKFSPRPVLFTTLRRLPLHQTRFEHCPNSTEAPTRSWTPLPCIYQKYHLYWRFTRYHNYKKLFRCWPESWINSGHVYKTSQRSYDLDTLLQLRQAPPLRDSQPYWHLIIITASCTPTIALVLYCSLRARFLHTLLCNVTTDEPSDTNPVPPTPSTPTPVPRHLEDAKQEDYLRCHKQ